MDVQDMENVKNVLRAMKSLLLLFKEIGISKQNIRRIYLKTETSESLPVFTQLTKEEVELAKEVLQEREWVIKITKKFHLVCLSQKSNQL